MIKIEIWLNKNLGWRVESNGTGRFQLFNAFGYAGQFSSVNAALAADAAMSAEPAF